MIELATEYGLFLIKVATIVVAILFIVGGIVSAAARAKQAQSDDEGYLKIRFLNDELDRLKQGLTDAVTPDHLRKALHKEEKQRAKLEAKQKKKAGTNAVNKQRLFVLDFDGDIQAHGVEHLRREINAIIQVAKAEDEVVIRLESPGGLVHSYGLAASQLRRFRTQGIKLTVVVDKVAASGGYMMACIGDRIVSAPFAIIGSIGVVAQIPNVHRLLKKNDVDVELMTAGEYKRTLTVIGENTDKARQKFQQELDETHGLFKTFVRENRRSLDIDKVATGEHWFGTQAKELGLVDDIMTSDEYLQLRKDSHDIYSVQWEMKQRLAERLGFSVEGALTRVMEKGWQKLSQRPWQ